MEYYYGSWSVNHGSSYNTGYEGTNKHKLARDMRQIMAGNIPAGGTGRWAVTDANGQEMLSGGMRNNQYYRD